MADPAGILNGTDVPLYVSSDGVSYAEVCGETTSSDAVATALIETTNKCSEEYRTFLSGAGTRSLDVTIDTLYSDDAAYQILLAAAFNRTIVYCRRIIGSNQLDSTGLIPSSTFNYGLNETVTNSITINSTGEFTLTSS